MRLKNDNKRLLSLTERINSQRAMLEERFKEKKEEIEELEKELTNKKVFKFHWSSSFGIVFQPSVMTTIQIRY